MNGRICIVTGGNSGIGEATAAGLAKLGATVAIVSRNLDRGQAAIERIQAQTGRSIELIVGDLGSLAQIEALATEILAKFPAIHVLINNAGVWTTTRTTTPDGYETTFAVNHLAPFLLTHRLLDRLKASGAARVVNVASALYAQGSLDFDDLQSATHFSGLRAYSRSKMCNVLFSRALAKRLEGSGVTSNALHPGVVRSNLASSFGGLAKIGMILTRPFYLSAAKGAQTSIYLASSPAVAGVSGEYFVRSRARPVNRFARDPQNAERLWTLSAELCGI